MTARKQCLAPLVLMLALACGEEAGGPAEVLLPYRIGEPELDLQRVDLLWRREGAQDQVRDIRR